MPPAPLTHRHHRRPGAVAGRTLRGAAVLAIVGAGLAGCGDDGRELRPPTPDQTTTTAPAVPATTAPATTLAMQLTSPAFSEGDPVPARYGCQGEDVSPPLTWAGVPPEAVELAVVVRDVDAGGFVHWVVAGIPPATSGLTEGSVPDGAVEATNGFGRPGWAGPCPPEGTHNYELRVHALAQPSGVAAGDPGDRAAAAVEATPALGSAVLSAHATAPSG